jgi:hypothetical protein
MTETAEAIGTIPEKDAIGLILYARKRMAEGDDARWAAVQAVDGYHGYTCEFSGSPRQHIAEYDQLEAVLEGREW